MELVKIRELLEKYDAAETSIEEEKTLRDYFQNHTVSEDLQHYKMIFAFTKEQQTLKSEASVHLSNSNRKKINWSAIAAVLVIAIGVFYFFKADENLNSDDMVSASHNEMTYQQTRETLEMVSSIMNQGTADLGYLQEFNNTKNKIIQID